METKDARDGIWPRSGPKKGRLGFKEGFLKRVEREGLSPKEALELLCDVVGRVPAAEKAVEARLAFILDP